MPPIEPFAQRPQGSAAPTPPAMGTDVGGAAALRSRHLLARPRVLLVGGGVTLHPEATRAFASFDVQHARLAQAPASFRAGDVLPAASAALSSLQNTTEMGRGPFLPTPTEARPRRSWLHRLADWRTAAAGFRATEKPKGPAGPRNDAVVTAPRTAEHARLTSLAFAGALAKAQAVRGTPAAPGWTGASEPPLVSLNPPAAPWAHRASGHHAADAAPHSDWQTQLLYPREHAEARQRSLAEVQRGTAVPYLSRARLRLGLAEVGDLEEQLDRQAAESALDWRVTLPLGNLRAHLQHAPTGKHFWRRGGMWFAFLALWRARGLRPARWLAGRRRRPHARHGDGRGGNAAS